MARVTACIHPCIVLTPTRAHEKRDTRIKCLDAPSQANRSRASRLSIKQILLHHPSVSSQDPSAHQMHKGTHRASIDALPLATLNHIVELFRAWTENCCSWWPFSLTQRDQPPRVRKLKRTQGWSRRRTQIYVCSRGRPTAGIFQLV